MKKRLCFLVIVAIFVSTPLFAAESDWMTDFEEAKKESAEKKMPIFAVFSGLAWCPTCQYLEKEVLSKADFLSFAKKNFVLLLIDIPLDRALPATIARRNQELAEKYNVGGLPEIIVIDSSGKELNRIPEIFPEGVPAYINYLKDFLKNYKK